MTNTTTTATAAPTQGDFAYHLLTDGRFRGPAREFWLVRERGDVFLASLEGSFQEEDVLELLREEEWSVEDAFELLSAPTAVTDVLDAFAVLAEETLRQHPSRVLSALEEAVSKGLLENDVFPLAGNWEAAEDADGQIFVLAGTVEEVSRRVKIGTGVFQTIGQDNKGRYYLWEESQWQGSPDSRWEQISEDEARKWRKAHL
jgi:hypothetical protein